MATTRQTQTTSSPADIVCGSREATIGDLIAWETAAAAVQLTSAGA